MGWSRASRLRVPWSSRSRSACASVLLTTLYSLVINNITFATNDYRWIVIQAVAGATGSLLASYLIWHRVPAAGRVVLALCSLANLWTLLDAGGRRLLAAMGW
jgi:hypothetical protein